MLDGFASIYSLRTMLSNGLTLNYTFRMTLQTNISDDLREFRKLAFCFEIHNIYHYTKAVHTVTVLIYWLYLSTSTEKPENLRF